MTFQKIETGVVHEVPDDLWDVLTTNQDVLEKWNSLTPLARNEWICRITIVKKQVTREKHLIRFCEDIREWKKRPCCRPWCPHPRESAKKWFNKVK